MQADTRWLDHTRLGVIAALYGVWLVMLARRREKRSRVARLR
jgi:hypothetical protein